MDLTLKAKEVIDHIDRLQKIANRHSKAGKLHSFNRITEVINLNKSILQRIYTDISNNRRSSLYTKSDAKAH